MKDPLIEMVQAQMRAEEARKLEEETRFQITSKTGIQTTSQTIPQTTSQTEVETASTAQKQGKTVKLATAEKTEKQDSNNVSKNLETVSKNEEKNEFIEGVDEEIPEDEAAKIEGNSEGDENYIKERPDPLLDMVFDPGDTTVDEQIGKSTGESTKSLDTLSALGEMVLDYLDNSKAQLCAAISGKEAALFASDKKAKKALIEATKTYVQEIGLKPPTPAQTFLLAVGMWLLPSLGLAGFERFKLIRSKKEIKLITPVAPTPAPAEQVSDTQEPTPIESTPIENTPEEEAPVQEKTEYQGTQIDYTKCKEYEQTRRLFDRHAKGTYRHLSDGTYANVDLAAEFPSAIVLRLLEADKTNAEIRATLYGE